jgi:hypothetical protein
MLLADDGCVVPFRNGSKADAVNVVDTAFGPQPSRLNQQHASEPAVTCLGNAWVYQWNHHLTSNATFPHHKLERTYIRTSKAS